MVSITPGPIWIPDILGLFVTLGKKRRSTVIIKLFPASKLVLDIRRLTIDVPSNMHPQTCTLNIYPQKCALKLAPSNMHPQTCTLKTCTLKHTPSNMHPQTCTLKHAPRNMHPQTCTIKHARVSQHGGGWGGPTPIGTLSSPYGDLSPPIPPHIPAPPLNLYGKP